MAHQTKRNETRTTNTITVRIIFVALIVVILITLVRQIFIFVNNNLKTERAVLYTVGRNVQLNGVFVRDEKVVTYNGSGVMSFLYPDGSKIAKNSTIAEVYDSVEQITAKNEIAKIEIEIANLQRAQNRGTTEFVQPDFITKQIDEKYKQITYYIEHSNFEGLESTKEDMLVLMNIYNIMIDAETDYEDRIASLETKIANLKIQMKEPKDEITASESGYFVSYCDGYESILNYENINSLGKDDILKVFDEKPNVSSNYIGKMFDDYSWKMVAVATLPNRFLIGETLTMRLNSSSVLYTVTVEDVKTTDTDNEYILVLSCEQLGEELVESRTAECELIFNEYTGLKVPRDAICFNSKGEKGVYVLLGEQTSFKKLDIIYEGEDFVLSRNSSDSSYVLLYDQILLEGIPNDESEQSDESSEQSSSSE